MSAFALSPTAKSLPKRFKSIRSPGATSSLRLYVWCVHVITTGPSYCLSTTSADVKDLIRGYMMHEPRLDDIVAFMRSTIQGTLNEFV